MKFVLYLLSFVLCAPATAQSRPPAPDRPPAAAPPGADAAGNPYALDLSIGFGRFSATLKPGRWYPVWIFIQARQSDIEGQLTLAQPRNTLQVAVPFQVAKGSLKRYLAYYHFAGRQLSRIDVEVRLGRLGGERFSVPLRFAETGEQHILVLAEETGGFGALARDPVSAAADDAGVGNRAAPPPAQRARLRQAVAAPFGGTKVIYGEPDLLPEDPIALEGLDGIIFTTPRVRALNARQWAALQTWIASGGRLLLAGGRHQSFVEQSVLKGAYGLRLAAPQPAPAAGLFDKSAATSISLLASWPEGEWTRVELGDEKHPLIVGKQAGRGWFHLCAAALDEPLLSLIKTHGDGERLWPALLERHFARSPLEELAETAESAIGFDLQRPFGFNLVGAWWVFGFLGGYILLALPMTWLVCGRLRRREWAWPVAIVLALGFAWYGYASGLRSQSSVFQANEVTILTHAAGAPAARAVTFSSIFSPRRYRADLVAPAGAYPNRLGGAGPGDPGYNPYGEEDLYSDTPLALSFQPPVTRLAGFFFHPWSARSLRCDFTVPAGGGVAVSSRIVMDLSGALPAGGKITNNTPWDFKRWWIGDGQVVRPGEGPLKRGAVAALASIRKNPQVPNLPNVLQRAIITNIMDPALRELSGDRRRQAGEGGNPYWGMNFAQQPARPHAELFFIGEAEGALSPLTQQMPLERRRGVLLYEAALPVGGKETANEGEKIPRRWTVRTLTPREPQQQSFLWTNEKNAGGEMTANLVFPPQTLDIQLVPERPVPANLKGALSFGFKVVSHPKEDEVFVTQADAKKYKLNEFDPSMIDPVTGLPIDPTMLAGTPIVNATPAPAVQTPKKEEMKPYPEYVFAGCPVKVFNFRRQAWEPTDLPRAARHTVSPIRDYLCPGSCALLLRIEGDPEKLLFGRKGDTTGAPFKTGVDIWGEEVVNGPNIVHTISFLKLKDVTVKLEGR